MAGDVREYALSGVRVVDGGILGLARTLALPMQHLRRSACRRTLAESAIAPPGGYRYKGVRSMTKPLSECRLYAFVDTSCLRGRAPNVVAQQLCEGGADLIQLRAKQSSIEDVRRMAQAILPVTRAAGVGFVINDHPPLARELGAEYCHMGQEDFFEAGHRHVSELRPSSPKLRVGLSTHAPSDARRALAAGADYIAIGPVYATTTKPEASPVTLDYVRWAAANVPIPWFVIGGINLQNLDEVLAAGAKRICVVSAILNEEDVAEACRRFRLRMDKA